MPTTFNRYAFLLLAGEEGDNVVDNFCDSVGAVVGGTGIQLYDGWIHPFVAGARIGRSNN